MTPPSKYQQYSVETFAEMRPSQGLSANKSNVDILFPFILKHTLAIFKT